VDKKNKQYELVSIELPEYSLLLELKNDTLGEMYRKNPGRVESIVRANMYSCLGHILAGEKYDLVIAQVHKDAEDDIAYVIRHVEARNDPDSLN